MKRIIYTLIALGGMYLAGCDDMNDLHQKYLDEGERIYIGKPDSVEAFAGFNRVQLQWELNADPKIEKCLIYWNNRTDSVVYSIDRSQDNLFRAMIPLSEGKYNFELLTRDNSGNYSLTEKISAVSYGEVYQQTIYNRKFASVEAVVDSAVIIWRTVQNSVGLLLTYVNNGGVKKTIYVPTKEDKTVIKDYKLGGIFSYRSLYLPEESAIDSIPVLDIATGKFPDYVNLDRSDWEITYASTQESLRDGPAVAANILDNDPSTFWHTQWDGEGKNPPLPHTIIIDMKKTQQIATLLFARRQNNKDLARVEFEISDDNVNWTSVGGMDFPNNATPNSQTLTFDALQTGRYLKLIVTESNNGVNASISGIYFTGLPAN